MPSYGDGEAGFSVDRPSVRIVRVRAWGFWGPVVAEEFAKAVADACRTIESGVTVVIDAMDLKPQREEGQAAFGAAMGALKKLGSGAVQIASTPLTKLQLLRIAKEARALGTIRFTSAL